MQRRKQRMVWTGGGALAVVVAATLAAAPAVPGDGAAERMGGDRAVADGVVAERAEADRLESTPAEASSAAAEGGSRAAAEVPAAGDVAGPGMGAAAESVLETQVGSASYYANMLAGRPTASGVPYDPSAAVAAHRQLPFGTRLRVHNLANGRVVEVVVVDRGPFAKGRILDLSRSAAEELGFIRAGHTRVRIEVLEYGE